MAFEDRAEREGHVLAVTDCAFAAFFWNASRFDLQPILCEWDAIWMGAVNASDRPVRVSRPMTIADGCARCTFCFSRAV